MDGLFSKDRKIRVNGPVASLCLMAFLLAFSLWPAPRPSVAFQVTARCDWSDQQYDDFYAPPDLGDFTPERLGELLRVEHIRSYTPEEVAISAGMTASLYGAETYRVLYLSQTPPGTPQAVSGLILVPTGLAPPGGFPVLAHGHGTTGLADSCASSRYVPNVDSLLVWVANGYLVSASDYVGLGTPGPHPYAVGESEAFSLLDSARAAGQFCDAAHAIETPPGGNQVILEGHSQGGHAALFAHEIWQSYAPELDLLGTVGFAPGSEPRLLTQSVAQGVSRLTTPAALALYAYSAYYDDPVDLADWLQEPYASQIADRVEGQCLPGLTLWLRFDPQRVFQPELIADVAAGRWENVEPLTGYLDRNTPGNFASEVPVLILQGEDDPFIPPEITERLQSRLCAHGTNARVSLYSDAGHTNVIGLSRAQALQWMADRRAGVPAPNGCPDTLFHSFLPATLR
jgi:pimeloyl-ACP methyl ester carboxylesterase